VIRTWGSTAAERALPQPCDELVPEPDDAAYRAVSVAAAPHVVFRWLCQLRVAPYSYDLLDNLGRRSPRTLTPGLDDLAVGQRFATIFRLASFEPDRHITILTTGNRVAVTYAVRPHGEGSRLLVKLVVRYPRWLRGPLRDAAVAGDLVMMRRQLLNFRRLAEAS
jgi:hypothetical protein